MPSPANADWGLSVQILATVFNPELRKALQAELKLLMPKLQGGWLISAHDCPHIPRQLDSSLPF